MKEKSNLFIKIVLPILSFFLGLAVMYGIFYKYPMIITDTVTRVEKNVTIVDNGIAEAVDKVYDAVVVVTTYRYNQAYASGTGFVYKEDNSFGYILTNYHVIEKADKVNVQFTNGEIVETEVLGYNELSDIAVLKVSRKDVIAVAQIGSSADMRVGDTTFAVGAPINSVYSWTVTRGILSGKDRMVVVSDSDIVMKVLQTDAAINNGNSGGPLCNANGEVIGITSMKLIAESVEGMGFAINIEEAIKVANKIENGENDIKPYIGIQMYNVSDAYYVYESMFRKYDITYGVLIYDVDPNSPASKAGLQKDDVIIGIADKEVTNVAYLKYYFYEYKPGDKIPLKINRQGNIKTINVIMGER